MCSEMINVFVCVWLKNQQTGDLPRSAHRNRYEKWIVNICKHINISSWRHTRTRTHTHTVIYAKVWLSRVQARHTCFSSRLLLNYAALPANGNLSQIQLLCCWCGEQTPSGAQLCTSMLQHFRFALTMRRGGGSGGGNNMPAAIKRDYAFKMSKRNGETKGESWPILNGAEKRRERVDNQTAKESQVPRALARQRVAGRGATGKQGLLLAEHCVCCRCWLLDGE